MGHRSVGKYLYDVQQSILSIKEYFLSHKGRLAEM